MLMDRFEQSKAYREQFVVAQIQQALPHQIRALARSHGLTLADLAARVGIRARDIATGELTLAALARIAAEFDVAFIGKFAPFSELADWYSGLPDGGFDVASFTEERESAMRHWEQWRGHAAEHRKMATFVEAAIEAVVGGGR